VKNEVLLTISLPKDAYEILSEFAKRQGISPAVAARRCVLYIVTSVLAPLLEEQSRESLKKWEKLISGRK